MNRDTRYFIILSLTALYLGYFTHVNAVPLTRGSDYIRGFFINETRNIFSPLRGSKPGRSDKFRSYTESYKNLPKNFYRAAPFIIYRAENPTSVKDIAAKAIEFSDIYSTGKLEGAIRKINALKNGNVEAGEMIIIPYGVTPVIKDTRNTKKPRMPFTRGIYLTGQTAGTQKFLDSIPEIKKLGINTVVFDVKDVTGLVTYRTDVPIAKKYNTDEKRTIGNIKKLIRELKEKEIYSIARIAVFHDQHLAKSDSSLAIRRKNGKAWSTGKEIWCDPTNRKVQDYNIALAVELANLGVDEIQFDYIRFPTTGDFSDAVFSYDFGKMSREESITAFLARAYKEISSRNTLLSIDIFGVVAWGKEVDIASTGQRIESLSKYCDAISPMLYPSHFNDDFDGFANPGDNPYYFLLKGCEKVISLSDKKAKVRPWLQAFKWRVSNYNEKYIHEQVKGTIDSGAYGYLFWNASNDYATVLSYYEKIKK